MKAVQTWCKSKVTFLVCLLCYSLAVEMQIQHLYKTNRTGILAYRRSYTIYSHQYQNEWITCPHFKQNHATQTAKNEVFNFGTLRSTVIIKLK